MDPTLLTLIITASIGIVFSFPVVRSSLRRDPVHGGILARGFHHLAVTAYLGLLPAALVGSVLVGPLRLGIPLALGLLAFTLLCLFIYAWFERPARARLQPAEDQGWTARDAQSSGL